MIKRLKYLVLGCLACLSVMDVQAQDPQFTQFYANPLYLNPALAGSHGCSRFSFNHRNEWPNLSGKYVTFSASYDSYFKGISGGLGIIAMHDRQGTGTIKTSSLGLMYSYHLKINRKFTMLFGAKAAWFQKSLNWDKLTFGDMIDPSKGFIYQTQDIRNDGKRGFFDASAGFVGISKKFFFGAAVHHLNTPDESLIQGEAKLPMRFTGHMGADLIIGNKSKYTTNTSLMPNIIFQYQRGFMELNIGTYLKYGAFTTGIWFRNRDAFILVLGVNTGTVRLGYSYDLTVSKLNNGVSGGSHEISLGFNLKCKDKKVAFKTISCPSF
ncbi:MAG: type IX secretion system membrane protein PorP/SprF [Bacteroidetes bacterium]|nr:MAG: type IX secretion system membrane protein PorP/SprF [Bacteroidota bacterium]